MALWADLRQQWALGTDSEVEAVDPGRTSPVGGLWSQKDLSEQWFWSQESRVQLLQMREPRLTERGSDLPRITPFKQAKASKPKFGKEFDV